jgi:hypothetical protein
MGSDGENLLETARGGKFERKLHKKYEEKLVENFKES